jgi:hypothetical protein
MMLDGWISITRKNKVYYSTSNLRRVGKMKIGNTKVGKVLNFGTIEIDESCSQG